MFNQPILDVFIGLIFIYLLYSLFASIIQEAIAKWFGLRPRMLMKSIARMLEDEKPNSSGTLFGFFKDHWENLIHYFKPFKDRELTEAFYKHPFIKYLGEGKRNKRPSYLNAQTFSRTLVYLLRNNDHIEQGADNIRKIINDNLSELNKSITIKGKTIRIPEETAKHIQLIWNESNRNIDAFQIKIQNWYNEMQERVTGWYTRQTQTVLFILGLFLAISFNIDSIAIYKILSTNSKVRNEIVTLAQNFSHNPVNPKDSIKTPDYLTKEEKGLAELDTLNMRALKLMNNDIKDVNAFLGLGWPEKLPNKGFTAYQPKKIPAIAGWIITALAISLGSSFWFDLLKRILKMRSSGVNPDEKKDNAPKG